MNEDWSNVYRHEVRGSRPSDGRKPYWTTLAKGFTAWSKMSMHDRNHAKRTHSLAQCKP
jgi:hypothetical protein